MQKNQHGFETVQVVVIVTIIAIIGLIGWRVSSHKSTPSTVTPTHVSTKKPSSSSPKTDSKDSTSDTSSPQTTTSTVATTRSAPANTPPSFLNGAFTITLPANWTRVSDSSISRTLNGAKYVVDFSLSANDTLTIPNNPYNNDISNLGGVTDSKGTKLWAYRSDADTYNSWVYAEGCVGDICSPRIGNQYLFALLSDQTSGQPQKLYFRYSNSDANTILGDFFQILQSSNI